MLQRFLQQRFALFPDFVEAENRLWRLALLAGKGEGDEDAYFAVQRPVNQHWLHSFSA